MCEDDNLTIVRKLGEPFRYVSNALVVQAIYGIVKHDGEDEVLSLNGAKKSASATLCLAFRGVSD